MRRTAAFLVALAAVVVAVTADAQQRMRFAVAATYSTTFSVGTENPISEESLGQGNTGWINGGSVGGDWSNIRTTTGKAFGDQTAGAHGSCGGCTYNDGVALKRPVVGTVWPANQDVRARVFVTSRSGWSGNHEVELLSRGSITNHRAQFYEAIFSVVGGTTYYEIVRWEGPVGDPGVSCTSGCAFTSLNLVSCAGVEDGTYIRFTTVGTALTQYTSTDGTNWTIPCSGTAHTTDSTYTAGLPGLGHWTNGNGAVNTYGVSEWSAR